MKKNKRFSIYLLTLSVLTAILAVGSNAVSADAVSNEKAGGDIVVIPDDYLRGKIKAWLSLDDDKEITVSKMKELENFYAITGGAVKSLEGLQYAENLSGQVTIQGDDSFELDLAPLANLTKITGLNLRNNCISDLTPIASLSNLRDLDIMYNDVQSIDALSGMPNLMYLTAGGNRIESLIPLKDLINLASINLDNNKFKSLSGLENAQNLQSIKIVYGELEDISALEKLGNLKSIQIQATMINSLLPFRNFENLEYLNVSHNAISDFTGIPPLKLSFNGRDQSAFVTLQLSGLEYEEYIRTGQITNSFHKYNESLPLMNTEAVRVIDSENFTVKDAPLSFEVEFNNMNGLMSGSVFVTIKVPTYSVSFNPNGGTLVDVIPDIQHGMVIDAPFSSMKEGYVFNGWYSDVDLKDPFTFSEPITSNRTLYAKWDEETKHQITYTDEFKTFEDQTYLVSSGNPTPHYLGTPMRNGYQFKGWNQPIADAVTQDVVYTALWEAIVTPLENFTITYRTDVNALVDEVYTVSEGSKTPQFLGDLLLTGYIFEGWSPGFSEWVNQSVVYVAQWRRLEDAEAVVDTVDLVEVTSPIQAGSQTNPEQVVLPNTGVPSRDFGFIVVSLGSLMLGLETFYRNQKKRMTGSKTNRS